MLLVSTLAAHELVGLATPAADKGRPLPTLEASLLPTAHRTPPHASPPIPVGVEPDDYRYQRMDARTITNY